MMGKVAEQGQPTGSQDLAGDGIVDSDDVVLVV